MTLVVCSGSVLGCACWVPPGAEVEVGAQVLVGGSALHVTIAMTQRAVDLDILVRRALLGPGLGESHGFRVHLAVQQSYAKQLPERPGHQVFSAVSITAPLWNRVLQHLLQIVPLRRAVFSNVDSAENVGGVPFHADGVAAVGSLVGFTKAATSFACLELAVEETLTLFTGKFSLLHDRAQFGVVGGGHCRDRIARRAFEVHSVSVDF